MLAALRFGGWKLWRRPLLYWGLVVALALLTAATVLRTAGRAEAALDRYGTERTVLVAGRALAPGESLDADAVRFEARPVGHLPDDALDALPEGTRLATSVSAGEVITTARLTTGAAGPVAAALPAGTRGVTIPLALPLPAGAGDRVDVVDVLGPVAATLVEDVPVVLVADETITVAVPPGAAADLTAAVLAGSAVPVLRPASRP